MTPRPLEWIKNNLHPQGGVRAWAGGPAYPEVTGYLIPTLLRYDEIGMAIGFADWLGKVQNKDGSFNGLDGKPRSFDTAACLEGLSMTYLTQPAGRAREWLSRMHEGGVFWTTPERDERNDYTIRVNGIMGIPRQLPEKIADNRVHYIAYALEGALELGEKKYVQEKLGWMRSYMNNGYARYEIGDGYGWGFDPCATAQLGILYIRCGMGDQGTLAALERATANGYPNAWTAKYHLDLLGMVERAVL